MPDGTGMGQRYATVRHAERDSFVASAAVLSEFRDTEVWRPYVGGGLDLIRARDQATVVPSRGAPPDFQPRGGSRTDVRVAAVGGTKTYVTPRTYLRAELRMTSGGERAVVSARFGVGIDF